MLAMIGNYGTARAASLPIPAILGQQTTCQGSWEGRPILTGGLTPPSEVAYWADVPDLLIVVRSRLMGTRGGATGDGIGHVRNTKPTDARVAAILNDLKGGTTFSAAARKFGISAVFAGKSRWRRSPTHPAGSYRWVLTQDFLDDTKALVADALARANDSFSHTYTIWPVRTGPVRARTADDSTVSPLPTLPSP